MKEAQKSDHVNLLTLIDHLGEGRFEIPDFQREFEWGPSNIQELMKSIFRDYYIGNLLLWKGNLRSFEDLACEPINGYSGERNRREHIVLDGQQRLSAMYYAFIAPDVPAPKRKNRYLYFIRVDKFQEESYDTAFLSDWRKYMEDILDNSEEQYRRHLFPLSVLGKGGWDLSDWFRGYESFWMDRQKAGDETAEIHVSNGREFGDYMRELVHKYQISYIELQSDLDIAKICDIFAKINSTGKPLAIFDLLNALLKPKGLQLKHMWREAEQRLNFVEFDNMNVYALQVMSILRQGYLSARYLYFLVPGYERTIRNSDGTRRHEVQISDTSEFTHLWNEAITALEYSISRLQNLKEFGVIQSKFLPYQAILPVFAALEAELRALPAPSRLASSLKFRYWYWTSVFTQRYSGATESTAATDYRDMLAWFGDDSSEPSMIREFRENIGSLDLHSETRLFSAVYRGIINILAITGARDWISGISPSFEDLDDHHIVPKRWGKEHRLGNSIDTILNRTLLSADTNRNVIRSRLPNEYIPEMIEQNGEDTVRSIFASHLISPVAFEILQRNPFTPSDFKEFINARKDTILEAIARHITDDTIDLDVGIEDLNDAIESVEVALRVSIYKELGGSFEDIKGLHFFPKLNERIANALRRDPSLDHEHYATLAGKLEYFDLREVEDTIKSKQVWDRFVDRFGSKEELALRFRQLAELRNAIRHSRSAGAVTRKDGQAAILWFHAALGLED